MHHNYKLTKSSAGAWVAKIMAYMALVDVATKFQEILHPVWHVAILKGWLKTLIIFASIAIQPGDWDIHNLNK